MTGRGAFVRVALLVAVAMLAAFAFLSTTSAPKAEAVAPGCTFTPSLEELIQQGGGSGSVTCTFAIQGVEHVLVVDFTVDPLARPPITIDGCTLDGEALHVGPCP
jgi:hypothetical protein